MTNATSNFEIFTTDFLYHVNARLRGYSDSDDWPDPLRQTMEEHGFSDPNLVPSYIEKALEAAMDCAYFEGAMGRSIGQTAYRTMWLTPEQAEGVQTGNFLYDKGYACAAVTRQGAIDHAADELRAGKGVPEGATVQILLKITLGYGAFLLPGVGDPDPLLLRTLGGNIAKRNEGEYVLDRHSVISFRSVSHAESFVEVEAQQLR